MSPVFASLLFLVPCFCYPRDLPLSLVLPLTSHVLPAPHLHHQLYRQAAFFPIFFLISELSVPSTNWVWMLRTLHAPKSSLRYRLAHGTRSLSFLIFRSFLAPLCLWYAWQQVAPGYEATYKWKIVLKEVAKLPWIITAGTSFNVCFLGMLNIWWTVVMGMGVLFPSKREQGKKEQGKKEE